MGEHTRLRPENPYDRRGADVAMSSLNGFAPPRRIPRAHDTEMGPGLTATDLDQVCRAHFQDGYAAAERKAEREHERLRERLAEVFAEGAEAQDGLNTSAVWLAVYRRLMVSVHFPLQQLEQAPKAKRDGVIAQLRAQVKELLDDAERAGQDAWRAGDATSRL